MRRLVLALLLSLAGIAEATDLTNFQTAAPWSPSVDLAADVAIVYGTRGNFDERIKGWRDQGYGVAMMTGISWGDYSDYYGEGDGFKRAEVQTMADGNLRMHGVNVGYNVPTPAYVEYMKQRVAPAIDAGAVAIYLEEPEFWANTGWSEAFKAEWQRLYGEPWQAPDSSVDAQYKASRLKYELYTDALAEVFRFAKQRAKEQGRDVECHVPTHSLINYAHWGIVSPMSRLMDIPEADGYIAQVWTGTARTPNRYRGKMRERTFEAAYFEYGQAIAMTRPTGRKVWFLHDPIEDNPNHTWADYKVNYEATVVASLLWPDVHRFEIVPWPNRVFEGQYPKEELERKPSGERLETERVGIPPEYAVELLTIFNALTDMNQHEVRFTAGEAGLGILVSDTMMFQRAAPEPSDHAFGNFYGLALPLIKHGIPAQIVQLETLRSPADLGNVRTLLLTYEGQKPLKPDYHEVLAQWVREGGKLLIVDDNADPFNAVKEWWNDKGATARTPRDALLESLGMDTRIPGPANIEEGRALLMHRSPTDLSKDRRGPEVLLAAIAELTGSAPQSSDSIRLERGPYSIVAALDPERTASTPTKLEGQFIDLFDANHPLLSNPVVLPGERRLFRRVDESAAGRSQVLAASARIRDIQHQGTGLSFTARGPAGTQCRIAMQLQAPPAAVTVDASPVTDFDWNESARILRIAFENIARPIKVDVSF